MLNNLPIGVYMPGQTLLHRLRARTKLLVLIWLALLCFLANHRAFHFGAYLAAFLLLGSSLVLTRVSLPYIWRRIRLLMLLLLIGVPFSLIFTPGVTWRTFGPIVVTYDGIWFVFSFGAIFLLLYLGSMVLTLTTTPVALAEGVMLLLRPFRRFGLPVEEFGLMTLVCLRFIPVLIQEAEQLVKAQISRGADFTSGSVRMRIHRLGSLLVPLIQGALRRAANLSLALEARGYGATADATLLHEGPLRPSDWMVLTAVPLLTSLAFWKLL